MEPWAKLLVYSDRNNVDREEVDMWLEIFDYNIRLWL